MWEVEPYGFDFRYLSADLAAVGKKMKNTQSLKKSKEFRDVYTNGRSYANKYLVMYILRNELDLNRLGISVSKKVGNSVTRNLVTRLIRESYRLSEGNFKKGIDIVIIGRINAKEAAFKDIKSAVEHLGKLQGVFEEIKRK